MKTLLRFLFATYPMTEETWWTSAWLLLPLLSALPPCSPLGCVVFPRGRAAGFALPSVGAEADTPCRIRQAVNAQRLFDKGFLSRAGRR